MVDNTTPPIERAHCAKPGRVALIPLDGDKVLSVPADRLGLGVVGEGPDAEIRIHLVVGNYASHAGMDAQSARMLMANIARALEILGADGSTN